MSEAPNNEANKEAMGQLSVTADDSDETSTPPKNLSDMPVYVVGLIIERSDYKEQLILRKTSKSLRALVDNQKSALTYLRIDFSSFHICCSYNYKNVIYGSPYKVKAALVEGCEKAIVRKDYKKIAFDDLASTLKNPKLQLERLRVFLEDTHYFYYADIVEKRNDCKEKFDSVLESIGHQLSVRECRVEMIGPGDCYSIISYLKPGALEKVTVYYYDREIWDEETSLDTLKEFSLLDQWKQAKELKVWFGCGVFPMEYATHFKRFHFSEVDFTPEKLIRIRDFFLEHENPEFCSISIEYRESEFRRFVGKPVSENLSHYSIPDSNDYLEFKLLEDSIEIRKIRKS